MINSIDLKILKVLYNRKCSVGELIKIIKVAPVNMGKHLKKLEKLKLIEIKNNGIGKKKEISSNIEYNIPLYEFIDRYIK